MWIQKFRENEKLVRAHTLRQQHQIQGKSSINMENRETEKEKNNNQQHIPTKKEKVVSRQSSRSSSKENTTGRKRGRPGRRKRKAEKPKIPARGGCGIFGTEVKVNLFYKIKIHFFC